MNNDSIIFIGLDTHKSFIQVAVLQEQRGATPEHLGRIKSNKSALIKLTQQLQSKYPKATLHFVYEAGPCGGWALWILDIPIAHQPWPLLLRHRPFPYSKEIRG